MFFTCKNFVFRFYVRKNFAPGNGGSGGADSPCPPIPYGPEYKRQKLEILKKLFLTCI